MRTKKKPSSTPSRLAGRFIKDDFLVDCNGEGIEYLQARVNGWYLNEIIEGKFEVEQLDCLVPSIGATDSYATPLVLIQMNIFKCGELAIAVRVSHKHADALTGISFINAWATASRVGVCVVISPSCFYYSCETRYWSHQTCSTKGVHRKDCHKKGLCSIRMQYQP